MARRWSGTLINLIVAISTIVFMTLCVVAVTEQLTKDANVTRFCLAFGFAFVMFFLLGRFINFDQISPHYFYFDRLSESYLQTNVKVASTTETRRNDADLPLSQLHDRFLDKEHNNPSPYHLIECALNLSGSNDLTRKDRKSVVFVFSKHFCGSKTTGYVGTSNYKDKDREFTLGTALTISGAAASSGMGFYTSF
ncbi:MAG: hypothetical protein AAF497_06705, partial [Planctomycetota bacterium]